MAYNISGEAVMATEWTLFALAYSLVGLRIGVRVAQRQQKHVMISDCLLIVSALDCLGLIICDTWTYALGGMRYIPRGLGLSAADIKNSITLDKVNLLLRHTWCIHPKYHAPTRNVFIDWAMNWFSDGVILILPFPLLRHLHLSRNQIYGLLLTFALGLVTIAVNLARFITIHTGNNWNTVFIWSMTEMAVAIMVVSLPALKTLLRRKNRQFLIVKVLFEWPSLRDYGITTKECFRKGGRYLMMEVVRLSSIMLGKMLFTRLRKLVSIRGPLRTVMMEDRSCWLGRVTDMMGEWAKVVFDILLESKNDLT